MARHNPGEGPSDHVHRASGVRRVIARHHDPRRHWEDRVAELLRAANEVPESAVKNPISDGFELGG